MKKISTEQVIEFNRKICHKYGIEHVILNRNLIESAVGATFFELSDHGLIHGEIPEIAAILCYKIIKNHAFKDANKRTAAIASLVFLEINNFSLIYSEDEESTELQKIIEDVASGFIKTTQLKDWFLQHARIIQ